MNPRVNWIDDFSRMKNGRLKDMTPLERLEQYSKVLGYWVAENYALRAVAVEVEDQAHLDRVIAFIESLQADALKEMKELGYEVIR